MSFLKYKDLIEEGDTVIIYLNASSLYAIEIVNGKVFQTSYGALKHNDLIGHKYGTVAKCTKGYVHVLFPTPELWTLTLPHRTQIIYTPDISMIIMQLDLQPGYVVCEAGTGSGSLSHAFIRVLAPHGHLNTYDFHEGRAKTAREEFEKHQLQDMVTVRHRDVVENGFLEEGTADAIFLDLPLPWKVIPKVVKSLKKNNISRLVSFSPCIEQVQRTTEALTECGFSNVSTLECLSRPYDVKMVSIPFLESGSTNQNSVEEEEENESASPRSKKRQGSKTSASLHPSDWAAFPSHQAPGHTGYLTVATLVGCKITSKSQ